MLKKRISLVPAYTITVLLFLYVNTTHTMLTWLWNTNSKSLNETILPWTNRAKKIHSLNQQNQHLVCDCSPRVENLYPIATHPTNPAISATIILNAQPTLNIFSSTEHQKTSFDVQLVDEQDVEFSVNGNFVACKYITPEFAKKVGEIPFYSHHVKLCNPTTNKSAIIETPMCIRVACSSRDNIVAYSNHDQKVPILKINPDTLVAQKVCEVEGAYNYNRGPIAFNKAEDIVATLPNNYNSDVVAIWDLNNGKKLSSWTKEQDTAWTMQWNNEGSLLATTYESGNTQLHTSKGELAFNINGEKNVLIRQGNWHHDILTLFGAKKAVLWNTKKRHQQAELSSTQGDFSDVQISPDGSMVASINYISPYITISDTSGKTIKKLEYQGQPISIKWACDGSQLYALVEFNRAFDCTSMLRIEKQELLQESSTI